MYIFIMPLDRKAIASQMVSDLDTEIDALQLRIHTLSRDLAELERQREAAKLLAGMKSKVRAESTMWPSAVQMWRPKNLSEAVFRFLRDRCPNGATALELQIKLANAGMAPGSRTYIYKIVTDLETAGRIRKDDDKKWRVVAESNGE
jgi:hypothetical protein